MGRSIRLAVLASGEGTTLEGLAEAIGRGDLAASIVLVVSDRPGAHVLARAQRLGLATEVVPLKGAPASAWGERLDAVLRARGAELVLLAGFLTILPDAWLEDWKGRVINVHPSLLPKYGGRGFFGPRVHEAVLAAGDRETGATVHLVTAAVDRGPVLAQRRIPVGPTDTPERLRARLHPVEVALLIETIQRFADGTTPLPYRADRDLPDAR